MLRFKINKEKGFPLNVLCLGAHCDDIEIGCGGTILRLISENKDTNINWIVFASNKERAVEAKKSAQIFLADAIQKDIVIKHYRDSFFPYIGEEIKTFFEEVKKNIKPDIIFTHYRNDLHQDHRLISELTWNTFRCHFILEYEVIKYDGDLGSPNFIIPIEKQLCKKKIRTIINCFKSQSGRHWFTEDTFFSMMRIRGVEGCCEEGFAEAFYCRKILM